MPSTDARSNPKFDEDATCPDGLCIELAPQQLR
jgi:hypothetical protein